MTQEKKVKKLFIKEDEQDESLLGLNALSDKQSTLMLLGYLKTVKWQFALGILALFFSVLAMLFTAKFIGELIEKGLVEKNFDAAMKFSVIIIILEIISMLCSWKGKKIISENSSICILEVRKELFRKLEKLPMSFFDRQPKGRIITRLTHDVQGVEDFFSNSLSRFIHLGLMVIFVMIAMVMEDLRIGLILIITMLPAIFSILLMRGKIRVIGRRNSKNSSTLNSKLAEFLNGMDVIRIFGLEKWSKQKYDLEVAQYLKDFFLANSYYSWSRPFLGYLCTLPLLGLVWFGGLEVIAGTMTVGIFVTFIRYTERFYRPIIMLSREIQVIQQAFTSAERVAAFLSEKTEEVELGINGEFKPQITGEVEFQSVWMAYDKLNWVIKDLSLKINKGEKVGLVGKTGCGKSTLMSLLSRLYAYQNGEILIDGENIKTINREYLRSQFGFVSQDVMVFHGSLRENLTSHNTDRLTDKEILEICNQTGFDLVIEKSRMSLDSEVLEAGANLSLGEKQLLSLTRVLISDPKILILDEATASIDPYYESIIQKAVIKLMDGRTCFMIAHRLATLKACDRIILLDKGELKEEGSIAELLESKGHYYKLYHAQSVQSEQIDSNL